MPRFVLLFHDYPFPHWDLMVEAGAALKTWRLHALPSRGVTVVAEPLGDHRLAYLDYEGPVSRGRGTVKRVDAGTFEWIEANQSARIYGQHLIGELRFEGDGTVVFK